MKSREVSLVVVAGYQCRHTGRRDHADRVNAEGVACCSEPRSTDEDVKKGSKKSGMCRSDERRHQLRSSQHGQEEMVCSELKMLSSDRYHRIGMMEHASV